jgi:hypothetical protein
MAQLLIAKAGPRSAAAIDLGVILSAMDCAAFARPCFSSLL